MLPGEFAQQTHIALDTLYDCLLNQLHTLEDAAELHAPLERLCDTARSQDGALPLALLPVWSYAAAGGRHPQQAVRVAAAWRTLHLAAKLLNDAGSRYPNTLLPDASPAELLNVGLSLIFLSQSILATDDLPPVTARKLQAAFAQAGLQAAAGQQTRLKGAANDTAAAYQAIVDQRSGVPFALATRAGALLKQSEQSGGDAPYVQALAGYGTHLGRMIQLADDFNGVWRPRGRSDLASGKRAWPLIYAETLADPAQRVQLAASIQRAPNDPAAEAAARALFVQLNVPLALVLAAEEQRHLAETALASLPDSKARQALLALARRISLAPAGLSTPPHNNTADKNS